MRESSNWGHLAFSRKNTVRGQRSRTEITCLHSLPFADWHRFPVNVRILAATNRSASVFQVGAVVGISESGLPLKGFSCVERPSRPNGRMELVSFKGFADFRAIYFQPTISEYTMCSSCR